MKLDLATEGKGVRRIDAGVIITYAWVGVRKKADSGGMQKGNYEGFCDLLINGGISAKRCSECTE